jgi:uncharacterized protein YndB with AHSA1/START domain
MNMQAKVNNDVTPQRGYGVVTAPDTVRLERLLPGPIERVWSYLTDSEKRGQWLATGEMELEVGGRVEHVFNNSAMTGHDDPPPAKYAQCARETTMLGRIVACAPPHLLTYTWGKDSQVSFELSRQADKVKLVLTHTRLATREDMLGVAAGWHAHVDILIDRLNNRQPESFWPLHTRLEAEYEQLIPLR